MGFHISFTTLSLLAVCFQQSLVSGLAFPTIPDTLGTHDPSRLIKDGDCWYFYSTGDNIPGWYTCDGGSSWDQHSILDGIPSSVHQYVPSNDGKDVWAPDVIWNHHTKLFLIFYAVAEWGDTTQNAIGLVTSPTLDPSKAVWKDMGTVIYRDSSSEIYQAIDPGPFFDDSGNLWLSLGSSYGTTESTAINIIPLETSGLRSGTEMNTLQACTCEATVIHKHAGTYYLFWNEGGCCDGASSTYTIYVASSTTLTGGFDNASVFLSSSGSQHGPGQIGFTQVGGTTYFTYHYYPDSGGSVLGYGTVDWSSGKPVATVG